MFCRNFDEFPGAFGGARVERFATLLDGWEGTAAERAQLRQAAQGVA